ncbi:MAG: hypothetical protein JXR07_02085 [Reichenbachiella sp.]
MQKRLISYGFIVVLLEVVIYFFSVSMSDQDAVKYSLASRYSARVTLVLLEGLLLWTAISGLKSIFSTQKGQKTFVLLLSLILLNHLIHLVFLVTNHWVNDYQLFTLRTAGGMIGYVVLILSPVYLNSQKKFSISLYWKLIGALLIVDSIAFISYIGRWNKELPLASSKEVYIGIMGCIVVILLMNVYRIFAERKIELKSTFDE